MSLLYFHQNEEKARLGITPDISGGAFFYTGNNTWGGGLFHVGFWKKDSIRFIEGLFRINLNIHLFTPISNFPPLEYGFNSWAGLVETTFRIGDSPFWIGARIVGIFADTSVEIKDADTSFRNDYLTYGATFSWDTRDSTFTPSSGRRGDLDLMFAMPIPYDWERAYFPVALTSIKYRQPFPWMVLGDRILTQVCQNPQKINKTGQLASISSL